MTLDPATRNRCQISTVFAVKFWRFAWTQAQESMILNDLPHEIAEMHALNTLSASNDYAENVGDGYGKTSSEWSECHF